MVKIKYQGIGPIRYRVIGSRTIGISPGTTIDLPEQDAKVLLESETFQLANSKISKVESFPEPKTLSRPSKTVDEKEEAPEKQKPEKKEKVLKAKPKAKKPKLKKDKLRKKLQSKRAKK